MEDRIAAEVHTHRWPARSFANGGGRYGQHGPIFFQQLHEYVDIVIGFLIVAFSGQHLKQEERKPLLLGNSVFAPEGHDPVVIQHGNAILQLGHRIGLQVDDQQNQIRPADQIDQLRLDVIPVNRRGVHQLNL